jgi:hypothetical protein
MSRYVKIRALIVDKLAEDLGDSVKRVYHVPSKAFAELGADAFPCVAVFWSGFDGEHPEESFHIRAKGPATFTIMVFAISPADPIEDDEAHEILDGVKASLVEFSPEYSPDESPGDMWLMREFPEDIQGMLVTLVAVYGVYLTMTA